MVNSNFSDAESPHDAVSIADNCGILAPGLDINDNCNSFLSGLPIVTSLLERGVYRMVAFVCSAAWYRGIRPGTDSGPLADGAVAVIFEAADVPTPFIDCRRSLVDRRFKDLVSMKLSVLNGRVNYLQNRRIAGFPEFIMTEAPAAVLGFIKDNGLTPEGIDWFFPHQPAHNAAHRWCRQLGFPPEKMVETFNEIGNITSAVIPYNIMRAVLSGGFASGSRALLLSLGGGFVLNAAVCNLHVADDFISNG
jgi:3-oxoacyl-[acyl-carrier-protein] synthase-3